MTRSIVDGGCELARRRASRATSRWPSTIRTPSRSSAGRAGSARRLPQELGWRPAPPPRLSASGRGGTGPARARRRWDAELVGGTQRPGGLAQGCASEQDDVGLTVGEDLLRLLGLGDQSDGAGRRCRPRGRRRPAAPGSRARPGSRPVRCRRRRRRRGRPRAPSAVRRAAVLCSRSQPPSIQSVPEIRTSRGAVSGSTAAHGIDRLEQQPGAVLEGAAVVVVAAVRQRREELVEQVAVRRVDLDGVEADVHGAPGGVGEGAARRSAISSTVEGCRVGVPLEGDGRGRDRRPATLRRRDRCRTAAPRAGRSTPCARRGRAACRSAAPWECTNSTIRRHASACSSFQMPASCGEIRPSGTTADASVNTSPKPPLRGPRGAPGASRPARRRWRSTGTSAPATPGCARSATAA